jgi:rhodanese-related sulfurtransferase
MKRWATLLLLLLVAVIGVVLYYTFQSPYRVSAETAKKLIYDQEIDSILDVRSKMEYNLGHYPEAIHIPTQDLADQVQSIIPNKKSRILVYCNTGQRSRYATDLLRAKGYTNVLYITGPYWSLLR